ncbi:hypothetical protein [Roseivirga pacifica]|uniref:hypothetical protein n=1 Tax=Roseivirga pacifica TaxID=1267423 RepID=UPI0020944184|nr:hypothetical protein [Roseivirga pacifica]MCO6359940.1 hypothetical protein [Roseivirga pacifica]MCO6367310.1 hypothetical protein [Roseivirga pacifica]MCO6370158.1 hypothetical protein [Roseivirga pacifica]MCO6374967.1 hypothetical protein [Roseivirga pacifica]MCO6380225.1 hypothetical protein [Roseivirga pacifica]
MLTTTKRKILHAISLTLAIGCMGFGFYLKYQKAKNAQPVFANKPAEIMILEVSDTTDYGFYDQRFEMSDPN